MPKKNYKGFTLVETIIVVFMFTILTLGVSAVTITIFKSYRQQSQSLNNIDQVTMISSRFASEIRNSAYGNDGSYPLNFAGSSEIIFYSSGEGSTVNRIRYYLSGDSLYKGIIIPTGIPLTYDQNSEIIDKVQNDVVNNSTTTVPVFYYYDGNYSGNTAPLAEPVNINQVKFVKMNLIVLKQPGISTTTTFYFNTGATMRNLKNNLGN